MKVNLSNNLKKLKVATSKVSSTVKDIFVDTNVSKETGVDAFEHLIKTRYPYLNNSLPYRLFDEKSKIFKNSDSWGIAKEIAVMSGANENNISDIHSLINTTFPEGSNYHYQFVMTGFNHVYDIISINALQHSRLYNSSAERALSDRDFYEMSAKEGFPTKDGGNYTLKDYRCYLFITTTDKDEKKLTNLSAVIDSKLQTISKVKPKNLDVEEFLTYLRNITVPNNKAVVPNDFTYNEYELINKQATEVNSKFHIDKEGILFESGNNKTKVISVTLSEAPSVFFLNQMSNLLASEKNPDKSLSSPFYISHTFSKEKKADAESKTAKKTESLSKLLKTPTAKFSPNTESEYQEYSQLSKDLDDNVYGIGSMSLELIIFSNEKDYLSDISIVESLFSEVGATASLNDDMSWQSYIFSFPFTQMKMFADIKRAGRTKRFHTGTIANTIPIIGDWKGAASGVLIPSQHNQIAFYSPFQIKADSYSFVVAGASGSGKSVSIQEIMSSELARGAQIFIQDNGESHKSFTKNAGGVFMDSASIRLNPFGNLDKKQLMDRAQERDEDGNPNAGAVAWAKQIELITTLICTMAYDSDRYDKVERAIVLKAVDQAYELEKQKANIDTIIKCIEKDNTRHPDPRKKDIVMLLEKYNSKGIYGEVFNTTNQLDETEKLFCLELNGFPDEIISVVVLAQFIALSNIVYSSRSLNYKLLVLEEFWKYAKKANKDIQDRIIEAIRTFRKFDAALCVISQTVSEFLEPNTFSNEIWQISSHKLIFRQGERISTDSGEFSDWEVERISKFRKSKDNGFSEFLLKQTSYSSTHRLFLSPMAKIQTTSSNEEVSYVNNLMITQKLSRIEAQKRATYQFYGKDAIALENYQKHKYGE